MVKSLRFSHRILLAASLMVFTTFALFTLYNGYLRRNTIYEDLESYLREMGDITSSNIQNWLGGRLLLVEQTAQTLTRDRSPEATSALLEQPALTSTFDFTYLGQQDGVSTMHSDNPVPAGCGPRSRPWYEDAIAAGGLTLTEPCVGAATQGLIITAVTPVKAAGNTLGMVSGNLSLETLVQIINSLDLSDVDCAFLVGGDGKILAYLDKEQMIKTLSGTYPQSTPKTATGFSETELHGHTRILAFTPIRDLPSVTQYLMLSINESKVYAMLSRLRASTIAAALISIVAILVLLGLPIHLLMQPLHLMGRAIQDVAQDEGDLTKRLVAISRDEFSVLGDVFSQLVERIHRSIQEIAGIAYKLHGVSQLVVNVSNSSMANSNERSNRTSSIAAAVNELGTATQEIARNAADTSHHVSDANHQAEDSKQVVKQAIHAMNKLSGKINVFCTSIEALSSHMVNIGQILEAVKGIFGQTNLLAFDAAIETARADEAERSFTVAANEVRNLAHRTQESTLQIQKVIEELQIGVREAMTAMTESQRYSLESVEIANRTDEGLDNMTRRTDGIDGVDQSVATATEGQTAMVDSLNMDITEINILNQEGVENPQATLRAYGELETQTGCLHQLMDSFKI